MGILTDTLFLAIFALPIMGLRGYVISEPPQNGGFVSFCAFTGANLTDGHWLGVYCENNDISDFGYNYTWLDLDLCVANRGGELIGYDSGFYSRTCIQCNITHTTTLILTCLCNGIDEDPVVSSLDLNTTIYDLNGSAGCFNHLGNKTWEGP